MLKRVFGADPAIAARRRHAFVRGMRAVAPATIATGTWGLVTGVAMVKVGLTTAQALGMTLLVYAGSAQLAALPLIAAAAPIWVVLLTATVVNLRFVIFSAGLRPFFRRFSLGRRLFLGYVTTDIGFALFLSRFVNAPDEERGSPEQVWFFLGMAAGNWMAWQTMSVLGIFLAAQVPGAWGLEFASILALDRDDAADDHQPPGAGRRGDRGSRRRPRRRPSAEAGPGRRRGGRHRGRDERGSPARTDRSARMSAQPRVAR